MENNYTLHLNRTDLCDLLMACTSIKIEARIEMDNDPNCSEERRTRILPNTIKKWERLHDILKTQLDEQDQKQEWYQES